MIQKDDPRYQSFIDAFDDHSGSCRGVCACGMEFYNPDEGTWTWEEGELEELQKLSAAGKARALDYAVGFISLEGKLYVPDCNCWQDRAGRVIEWLTNHAVQIADYLTREKKRKTKEAESSPVVKESE